MQTHTHIHTGATAEKNSESSRAANLQGQLKAHVERADTALNIAKHQLLKSKADAEENFAASGCTFECVRTSCRTLQHAAARCNALQRRVLLHKCVCICMYQNTL